MLGKEQSYKIIKTTRSKDKLLIIEKYVALGPLYIDLHRAGEFGQLSIG